MHLLCMSNVDGELHIRTEVKDKTFACLMPNLLLVSLSHVDGAEGQ